MSSGGSIKHFTRKTNNELTILQAAARFMEAHLGPFTQVSVNQLPVGPSAGIAHRGLKPLLEANDLSSILPELD